MRSQTEFEEIFPSELTEEEKAAGFRHIDVPNIYQYGNHPPVIKIVSYDVDPSHRLVKLRILGQIKYQLMTFGKYVFQSPAHPPEWYPDKFEMPAMQDAVQFVRKHLLERPNEKIIVKVPSGTPEDQSML